MCIYGNFWEKIGDKETKIDVNIIVEYGIRIPDVAFEIQNRVKKAVEQMTGLNVAEVNVHVQGVNTDSKDELKTEEMCLIALRNNPSSIKFIPKLLFSKPIFIICVFKYSFGTYLILL